MLFFACVYSHENNGIKLFGVVSLLSFLSSSLTREIESKKSANTVKFSLFVQLQAFSDLISLHTMSAFKIYTQKNN